MNSISTEQINKLLNDITTIKEVINDNKSVLKQLLLPVHFRFISFLAGIAIMIIAGAYYYFLDRFGEYQAIPPVIKSTIIGFIFVVYIAVIVLKRVMWMRSLKKYDKGVTFGKLIRNLYSYQLFHIWIPIVALIVFLSAYFYYLDLEIYIVAEVSIGFGFLYISIGSTTRLWQYLFTGYWMFLGGVINLMMIEVSPFIFMAISIGVAFILFAIFSKASGQNQNME